MSRSEANRARRGGLTLLEVGLLLFLVIVGGCFIGERMQTAKETGVRASAIAQLRERDLLYLPAEGDDEIPLDVIPGMRPLISFGPFAKREKRRLSAGQLKMIALFPETVSLNLDWSFLTDEQLSLFTEFHQLRFLSLKGSLITDDGLAVVTSFPELELLDLRYSLIKGPGLKHLKTLRNLKVLCLSGNELTDDCVSWLRDLPSLETVALDHTFILNRRNELESVGIQLDTPPSSVGLTPGPDPAEAAWLSPFQADGYSLVPTRENPSDSTIAAWQILRKLALSADSQIEMLLPPDGRVTCLRMRGAKMRGEHFQALTRMPDLVSLDLAVSRFLPDQLASLDALRDLRRIDLSRTNSGSILTRKAGWLSRIESLHLRDMKLTDGDVKGLSLRAPALRILDLTGNPLTDAGVASLGPCRKLEDLTLARTGISEKGIAFLARLPALRRLDLQGTDVRTADVQSLTKERPQLSILIDSDSEETGSRQ